MGVLLKDLPVARLVTVELADLLKLELPLRIWRGVIEFEGVDIAGELGIDP